MAAFNRLFRCLISIDLSMETRYQNNESNYHISVFINANIRFTMVSWHIFYLALTFLGTRHDFKKKKEDHSCNSFLGNYNNKYPIFVICFFAWGCFCRILDSRIHSIFRRNNRDVVSGNGQWSVARICSIFFNNSHRCSWIIFYFGFYFTIRPLGG